MNQDQYPLIHGEQEVKVNNPLGVMQPGERVICEIKRHPIGLIGVYAISALMLAVALSIAILTPIYASFLTDQQKLGVVLASILGMVITLIITYIAVYIYQANRWVVTSDSVTQITQNSLFDRHYSQLSLANLEDVSAEQHNILQELFGYGDITLETAGAEPGKFVFDYCPNPNEYARKIIAAHEEYIAVNPHEMYVTNRPLAAAPTFNQPSQTNQNQQ